MNITKLLSDQLKCEFLYLQNKYYALFTDVEHPKKMWLQFKTSNTEITADMLGYSNLFKQRQIIKISLEFFEDRNVQIQINKQSKAELKKTIELSLR